MSVHYQLSPKSVTVLVSGHVPAVFDSGNPKYLAIQNVVNNHSYSDGRLTAEGERQVEDLLFKADKVVNNLPGFRVVDGVVFVDNKAVPQAFGEKLRQLAQAGGDVKRWLNYWRLVKQNTSFQAQRELADMLERNHHPLLPDGRFIAWKGVRKDFYDKYSGKFNNAVGQVVKMDRSEVDDNRDNQCSHGLHVGSFQYASDYAGCDGVLVEVAVNPKHAVSVPTDHNFQKMRVSEYEVLAVSSGSHADEVEVNHYDYPQWAYDEGYEDFLESTYNNEYFGNTKEAKAYDDGWDAAEADETDWSSDDDWESDEEDDEVETSGLSQRAKTQKRDRYGRFTS